MYINICFRPGDPAFVMESDQVIVSLVGFHICMYYSCSCFMRFSLFNHTIIPHLYIFTPISIVSPNSLGLMLFVCSWCDKKSLSYHIISYHIIVYECNFGRFHSTREASEFHRPVDEIYYMIRFNLFIRSPLTKYIIKTKPHVKIQPCMNLKYFC